MVISCVKGCRLVLVIVAIGVGVCCHRPPAQYLGGRNGRVSDQAEAGTGRSRRYLFTLTDAVNHPMTEAQIEVEGDMSHAGMSPVFAQANEVHPGRYESLLSLAMAGDWAILLHGALRNGEQLERQFDVRDVRSN